MRLVGGSRVGTKQIIVDWKVDQWWILDIVADSW